VNLGLLDDLLGQTTRAFTAFACFYLSLRLLAAFWRNHYNHRPLRWLVAALGALFGWMGLDYLFGLWSNISFQLFGHALPPDTFAWLVVKSAVLVSFILVIVAWERIAPISQTLAAAPTEEETDDRRDC
jgi:hypothetical protein